MTVKWHEEAASPAPAAEETSPPPPIDQDLIPAPPPLAAVPDQAYDDAYDDGQSSFAHEPPFRPRRNPAKVWLAAAILFAVVALGAVAAVAWYGLPDWVPLARPTFGQAQPDLELDFPANRQERRTLPNGSEFFGASGTIRNVGAQRRSVPPILIVLRDRQNRIVYTWEVAPPKRQLAPGESVAINEAVTDVPKSAKFAEIGWKPD